MERDQEDNVRHELDNQFAALRELIYAPDPSSSGSNSIPLGVRDKPSKPATETDPVAAKLVSGDDYDQHVRELAYDQRAKPKDRTKTEEELALEAKEALEKAERRRRRRMLGLDESEDEDEVDTRKGKRKRGGDDLDDDYNEISEGFNGLGAGLEAQDGLSKVHDLGEEEEGSSEEGSSEDDGDGEISEESDKSEEEEEEGEHEQLVASSKSSRSKSKGKKRAKQDLPFTFPCPASHDQFLDIIENVDDEDVPTVIQRMRALYHTSLAADNKFKLQVM